MQHTVSANAHAGQVGILAIHRRESGRKNPVYEQISTQEGDSRAAVLQHVQRVSGNVASLQGPFLQLKETL
jgi:hypothetical protein